MHPIQTLPFPVKKTGTYYNSTTERYEFWFFLVGKTAKCGECKKDVPAEAIRAWRTETMRGLQARVLAKVATGELKVNPLPDNFMSGARV